MKKTILLLMLCLLVFSLGACIRVERLPSDGLWYCDELQAQFARPWSSGYIFSDSRYDENINYVIVNGDRIAIGIENDGTQVLFLCQDQNTSQYLVGDAIYILQFVSLSDTEYVLEDKETGKRYTFVRVGDSPDNSAS